MAFVLVLIAAFVAFIFIFMQLVLSLFGRLSGKSPDADSQSRARFKLRYVAGPLAILLASVALLAWFYGRLPAEVVLTVDAASRTTRGMLLLWTLLPQLLLASLAIGVVWAVSRVRQLGQAMEESGLKLDSLLLVMGNMVALPQVVLWFTSLNTLGYNVYQTRFLQVWWVVLGVLGAGAIALGVFFVTWLRNAWASGK